MFSSIRKTTRQLSTVAATGLLVTAASMSMSTTANANSLYNCAVDSGCKKVESESDWWRSSTKTKNPVVLVHGISGWSTILGIEYFYGVGAELMGNGTDYVFQPTVSGNNNHYVRGEQLLTQVNYAKAVSGKDKFNLIGHSQGAPTSRYVMGVAPDRVASLTTMGGVNWGSKVADDTVAIQNGSNVGSAVIDAFYSVFSALTAVVGFVSDAGPLAQDAEEAMVALSTESTLAFNQNFPVGIPSNYCGEGSSSWQGKKLYSMSGDAGLTNLLDPADIIVVVGRNSFAGNEPNDGLVASCSSHFGKVIRDNYALNHMDETNLFLGLTKFGVNPKSIYRTHVNRLKNAGM